MYRVLSKATWTNRGQDRTEGKEKEVRIEASEEGRKKAVCKQEGKTAGQEREKEGKEGEREEKKRRGQMKQENQQRAITKVYVQVSGINTFSGCYGVSGEVLAVWTEPEI